MILFLDTEFADLAADELVSLALVSEDAKHVFYAERCPLPAEATMFVQQQVYPLLDRGHAAMDDELLVRRLRAFLYEVKEPHIIFDFEGDWRLLSHVINGLDLPRTVLAKLVALPDVVATQLRDEAVLNGVESWFEEHPAAKRHHALVDARALREAWLKVNLKEQLKPSDAGE